MTFSRPLIAVVGAGIAGLATAIALTEAGCGVRLLERRSRVDHGGGAMLMWPNGFAALNRLGVSRHVRSGATPIRRVDLHNHRGDALSSWALDTASGRHAHLVFRHDLMSALHAVVPDAAIQLDANVTGCAQRDGSVELQLTNGERLQADAVVACDGIHSRLRKQLFGERPTPQLRQLAWLATVNQNDSKALPLSVAIGTIGCGQRFCAARVDEQRVFWYATVNATREPQRSGMEGLAEAFSGWHAPVESLITAADEDLIGPLPLSDLSPLSSWHRGRVVLLGDAAHACLPDLGQGAGQSLQSAVTLGECFKQTISIEGAFEAYEFRRRRAIASVMKLSRFVARWSMSEAVHVRTLRDLVLPHLLPPLGFPLVAKIAQIGG